MAESLAQKLNKLKASEMFVPYVQDREFGTYENNLTGQTVNREAELIFADQNKIRDAINTDLVQKHNDSLKPTYSSGDEGLARQLESKTYGVDGNKNLITPGNETNFIDESSDRYGQSEQNVKIADDKAAAKEQLLLDEKGQVSNELWAKANSGKISDADAEIFKDAKAKRTRFGLSESKVDVVDTGIPDEYVIRGAAEDGGDLYLPSNGESFADVLMAHEASKGNEVSGSFFTKGVSDILGSDRDSDEQRKYLTSGTAVFSDGTYEETDGRDFHTHLAEKAETARAEKEAMLEAYRASLPDDVDPANMTSEEKARLNDEYLGDTGLAMVHAGDDTFEDADGNLTNNQEVIEETKEKIERARALEKDPTLVADEKLIATANRIKEEKRKEEERVALEKTVQSSLDDEQSTNAKKIEEKRIVEAKAVQSSLDDEQSTNAATSLREKLKKQNLQSLEKAKETERILKDNAGTSPLGRTAEEQRKKAEIMKTARENTEIKFQRTVNESENAFQANDNQQMRNIGLGGESLFGRADDPFAFSSFAYPPGVTNSKENGHYILFYVNVQNKTKYSYDGIGEDGIISVGDEYQTTKPKDTSGPAGGAALPTLFHSPKGAKEMGYADDVAYKKQQLANGASGSILYNNQTFLSKNRKSKIPGVSQVFGATTTRITDSVALYLPPGIKSDLSAQYDDSKTGMFGFLAFSGKDIMTAMNDHDFDGMTDKAFDLAGTVLTEAGKKMAASAVSAVTGAEGVQATFDKAFGRTLNPYIEVTFGSMGMRTFDYTFKFSPKSEYETREAKAIIQLFRFHMAPELIAGETTNNRYLTLPSTFDIHYMYQSGVGDVAMAKENDFYNKIATCVLTSVNVDYTPNGEIQSFADGAPVQMTLALSFKETEMMTKDKINDGF